MFRIGDALPVIRFFQIIYYERKVNAISYIESLYLLLITRGIFWWKEQGVNGKD